MQHEKLQQDRFRMLGQIRQTTSDTASWTGRGKLSQRTMKAMETVPRHLFVPRDLEAEAYSNRPQQIGFGQTISQPYIVALMTDLLNLSGSETVLEIGTGCGYHTAVISNCVPEGFVCSVEGINFLAEGAIRRLDDLGYKNVSIRCGNGFQGWTEFACFQAIIVTAAPEIVPETLVRILENGGRMILPIGQPNKPQMLTLVVKDFTGEVTTKEVLPVSFVPMVDFDQ